MVQDVVLFTDEEGQDTPVTQKVLEVTYAKKKFTSQQDGYLGFAPY